MRQQFSGFSFYVICNLTLSKDIVCHYMTEILPIRRKKNYTINQKSMHLIRRLHSISVNDLSIHQTNYNSGIFHGGLYVSIFKTCQLLIFSQNMLSLAHDVVQCVHDIITPAHDIIALAHLLHTEQQIMYKTQYLV